MAEAQNPEPMQMTAADRVERAASRLSSSALLAMAGGFLDGFTFLGHGHVFANAMTGNVVLLALDLFSGSLHSGLPHLLPIVMFMVGVTVAKILELPAVARHLLHPHLTALMVQIGVLFLLSLLPQSTPNAWFTMSIAFAASVQVESFRRVNGRSYNSTFTTGNMRTFSESCFAWLFGDGGADDRRVARDFGVICLSFFIGAAAGGAATRSLGNRALWIDVALLLGILMAIWPRSQRASAS